MSKAQVLHDVQLTIGYQCINTDNLWTALQADGTKVDSENKPQPFRGNKRLAVVGDAVLKLALVEDWYPTGTPESRVADILAEVSTNDQLNLRGKEVGLDQYVYITNTGQATVSKRTMADAMEAILGAVYLDGGIQATKTVMKALGLVPA
ncbi:MAG: hypothetical protein Q9195_004255 [Heterodermia aff. obscurata]